MQKFRFLKSTFMFMWCRYKDYKDYDMFELEIISINAI